MARRSRPISELAVAENLERGNLRKELSSLVSMQGDVFQWIPQKGLQGGVFEIVIK